MVGAENINAYIYIYHLGLEFNLPTLPESITDTLSIDFQKQAILARSAPLVTLVGAGPRTTQVNITLHRQSFALENPQIDSITKKGYVMMPDVVTGQQKKVLATDAADLLINAISALSLPKYLDTAKAIVPPSLLIRYGNETVIRGVPDSITKTSSGVWLKNGKLALVSLSFNVTEVEPYSAQYVAQNGSMRGLSTTLSRSSVWQY